MPESHLTVFKQKEGSPMLKSGSPASINRPLAIVTGASRGIGKAIAFKLADEGYDLIITCLNNITQLKEVAATLSGKGIHCQARRCDAGSFEQVKALFDSLPLSGCQLLVNNAGISYMGLLTDMSPEEWRRVMITNVDSLYNTCSLAVPGMVRKKSGSIINISSIWGNDGASCEVAYSASKGAVNSFTKALAKELGPSGIRVNAIACGAIDTEMNQWMSDEEKAAFTDGISLGRLGTTEEIAETVAFLASKKAGYITGQIITVDGGIQ